MEGFHPVLALRPALHFIFLYFKCDILLRANCAECVNCCMSAGLQAGMERFRVLHALRPARLIILIYFKDEILLRGNSAQCVPFCM